jgi:hypothetical protein
MLISRRASPNGRCHCGNFVEGGGTKCRGVRECDPTWPQISQKSRKAAHPTRIRRDFPRKSGKDWGLGSTFLGSLHPLLARMWASHGTNSGKCGWGPAQDEYRQRRLKSSAFFAANSSSVRMFFWRRSARPSIVLRMSTAAKDDAVGAGAAATGAAALASDAG